MTGDTLKILYIKNETNAREAEGKMEYREEIIRMVKAMRAQRNLKSLYKLTRMWYHKEMEKRNGIQRKNHEDAGSDR
jgi:hypothetical protein